MVALRESPSMEKRALTITLVQISEYTLLLFAGNDPLIQTKLLLFRSLSITDRWECHPCAVYDFTKGTSPFQIKTNMADTRGSTHPTRRETKCTNTWLKYQ